MNPEIIKNNLKDRLLDSVIIGSRVLDWVAGALPQQGTVNEAMSSQLKPQPAAIYYHSTPEPPLHDPLDAYAKQLRFHEQELTRGLPPAMNAYHLGKIDSLTALIGEWEVAA